MERCNIMRSRTALFYLFVPVAFLIINSTAFAQNNGRISGTVTDKTSQQKLASATVSLLGTDKSVITDSAGSFRMTDIALNTYTLEV